MHETMVAESIFQTISQEAQKQQSKPTSAKISCGKLNDINEEILNFAFEAIAKGTNCEGLKLEVEHKPIKARCSKCQETFEFDVYQPFCTKCGSEDFKLLPDEPLILEEIEFEAQ